jgi:hypothetical protein
MHPSAVECISADPNATLSPRQVRAAFYSLYAEVTRLLHDPHTPADVLVAAMDAWGVRVLPGPDHQFLLEQLLPAALRRIVTPAQARSCSVPSCESLDRLADAGPADCPEGSVQLAAVLLLRSLAAQACAPNDAGECMEAHC